MSQTYYQKHATDRQVLQMDKNIIFGNEQKYFFSLFIIFLRPPSALPLSTVHILSFYTVLNEDPERSLFYTEVDLVYEF